MQLMGTDSPHFTTSILDSGATFIGKQCADGGNVGLGTCKVERILLDSKLMYTQ